LNHYIPFQKVKRRGSNGKEREREKINERSKEAVYLASHCNITIIKE